MLRLKKEPFSRFLLKVKPKGVEEPELYILRKVRRDILLLMKLRRDL